MPKIRNIIIFVAIGIILFLIYFFFIRSTGPQTSLVSSSSATLPNVGSSAVNTGPVSSLPLANSDFLTLLLSVQNIKLNDVIFSDPAFNSLHDSSITLIPDNNPGRSNPFAQFGNDIGAIPATVLNQETIPASTAPTPGTAPASASSPVPAATTTTNSTTPAPAKP